MAGGGLKAGPSPDVACPVEELGCLADRRERAPPDADALTRTLPD
jgi:hypothetical protein